MDAKQKKVRVNTRFSVFSGRDLRIHFLNKYSYSAKEEFPFLNGE